MRNKGSGAPAGPLHQDPLDEAVLAPRPARRIGKIDSAQREGLPLVISLQLLRQQHKP